MRALRRAKIFRQTFRVYEMLTFRESEEKVHWSAWTEASYPVLVMENIDKIDREMQKLEKLLQYRPVESSWLKENINFNFKSEESIDSNLRNLIGDLFHYSDR